MKVSTPEPPPPASLHTGAPCPGSRAESRAAGVALRDAAACLYSQMYYWGRDVLHPGGNLLVAYGFTRVARTTPGGTSRYRLPWGGGTIDLHGLRAGWHPPAGDGPGIVFQRARHGWGLWREESPDSTAMEESSAGAPCLAHERPLMLARAARFMGWVREYETWALDRWGPRERTAHHASYLRLRPRRWWLPPGLSLTWMGGFADHPQSVRRPGTFMEPRRTDARRAIIPFPKFRS